MVVYALIAVARAEVGLAVLGWRVRTVFGLRGDLAVHVAAAAIDRADLTGRLIQRVIHHHHHGCICDRFLLGGIRQGSCVIRALAADFGFRIFRLGIAAAGQQQRQKCKKHC